MVEGGEGVPPGLAARQADVDAHIELLALMMVLVRHFNHYTAGYDVLEKFFEFFRLIADVRFKCL